MVNERVLDLIAKLANVTEARGATEAEASTALDKMQRLLFQHNLSLSDVKVGDKSAPSGITDASADAYVRTNRKPGAGFKERKGTLPQYEREWRIRLASAVARYNFCSILVGYNFGQVIFVGTSENIEAVKAIWAYAVEQVDRLSYEALAYRRKTPASQRADNGKTFRASWLIGCVQRLEDRLYATWAELRRQSQASTALVVSNDSALAEYVAKKTGGRTVGYKSSAKSQEGLAAGYVAGSRVDLTRPAPRLN